MRTERNWFDNGTGSETIRLRRGTEIVRDGCGGAVISTKNGPAFVSDFSHTKAGIVVNETDFSADFCSEQIE